MTWQDDYVRALNAGGGYAEPSTESWDARYRKALQQDGYERPTVTTPEWSQRYVAALRAS